MAHSKEECREMRARAWRKIREIHNRIDAARWEAGIATIAAGYQGVRIRCWIKPTNEIDTEHGGILWRGYNQFSADVIGDLDGNPRLQFFSPTPELLIAGFVAHVMNCEFFPMITDPKVICDEIHTPTYLSSWQLSEEDVAKLPQDPDELLNLVTSVCNMLERRWDLYVLIRNKLARWKYLSDGMIDELVMKGRMTWEPEGMVGPHPHITI